MSKKFKKGAAIVLSTAMITQLGLQDGMLYVRADEENETAEQTQLNSDVTTESNEQEIVQESPETTSPQQNNSTNDQIPNTESEPAQDSQVQTRVSANLLVMNSDVTTQVQFVDENNNPLQGAPSSVKAGTIEGIVSTISFEGYDFVNATVNGDEIYSIGVVGDIWYYVPADDPNTGLLLGDSIIVFNYETHVETYTVSYNTSLYYEGPTSVREGESYSFTTRPSGKGKKLNVIVNDQDITDSGVVVDNATGLTRYTVEKVMGNQDVAITESDVETYTFTYNNDSIRQGDIRSPESGTAIEAGSTLEFTLRSDTWIGATDIDGHEWHLNLLAINKEYVNVPTTFNEGDFAQTILSSGEVVTVTLTDKHESGVWWNRYNEYTIAVKNVYTDIEVTDGNFKNAERNEIILKRLDGVSDIIGWDNAENDGDGDYRTGSINSVYEQTDRTGNEFYFNLEPGYTNPVVTVLANGRQTDIGVDEVSKMDPDDVTAEGYTYRVNIPNNLSDNVEVYITAEKQQYTVEYKVGDKILEDENKYTIFDGDRNELLLPEAPEYNTEEYIFEGWEYNGQIYQPNEVFQFNEQTIKGAENGVITFTAKLIPIEGSDYVLYTVEFLFQNEANEYVSKKEYPNRIGYGIKNEELFNYFVIGMKVPGYVLDEDNSDITLKLTNEENNIAEIRFKLDKNNDGVADEEQYVDVTFQIAEEDSGKGTIDGEASLTNLVPGLEMSVPSVVDTEGDDWAFDGWTPALTTDEEGNVVVPADDETYTATWKEDKNHDNKPDEDETKYTISYEAGTDEEVGNMPAAQPNVLKNTTQTVSTQVPTRSGYVFSGWTTEDVDVNEDGQFMMPAQDVTFTATWRVDSNGDGIADDDQDLTKPEDSDSNEDSESTGGEDTATATNVGIFASLATSALAGLGILAALKKRRKN